MPQLQPIDRQTLKENVQVFYGPKGKPASVILPFELFSRLIPAANFAAKEVYPLSDEQIVAAVDNTRRTR